MKKQITVNEDRTVVIQDNNCVGTIGENNATTLYFNFSESLCEYKKELVFNTIKGSFKYQLIGESFDLPKEILTERFLKLQIICKSNDDNIRWKSKPCDLTLNESLDVGGEHQEIIIEPENWYERIEEIWK